MVPSSAITISADGECLSRDGFSLGETIHFGSLEFIVDYFSVLSLPPRRDDSNAAAMGSTHSGPPSSLAITGDSTEEFHMASDEEGGLGLHCLRKHSMGASPAPVSTMAWPENTPTTQVMTMIPPRPVAL
jgi:hypothetical protein